jgi:DNA polymerase-3 subunit epsilon
MLSLWKKRLATEMLDRSIDDCRYVVIDTELTGLNFKKDEIISIGGIKMTGRRIELGKTFYATVKPRNGITKESIIIHTIMPSEVKDSPSIDSVISRFLNFCEDDIIVGHFISLDMKFINKELNNTLKQKIENSVLDTVAIYDWIGKQHLKTIGYDEIISGEKDLFSLAKKYDIATAEAHNALIDAFITAQLFQRLLAQVHSMGIMTVKDLLKIGGENMIL